MFSSTRLRRMANSCMEDGDLEVLCYSAFCFILYFMWKPRCVNPVFMLYGKTHLQWKCSGFVLSRLLRLELLSSFLTLSPSSSLHLSLRLTTFLTENPGFKLVVLSPPYFICIMRHSWLNCKCTPWLVLLQYVINACFFPSVFSYSLCVSCLLGGLQIGWIRLYACFKAQGVLFIGGKVH